MTTRFDLRREWLFAGLLAAYCLIYALWYPATISIEDESSNLALAYSIAHGTMYTETAGQLWGLPIGSHNVSKFSPFHAALLVPAFALNWKLVFLVSSGFFIAGAFTLRATLLRRARQRMDRAVFSAAGRALLFADRNGWRS